VDQAAWEVGAVVVARRPSPSLSLPTHKLVDGHETSWKKLGALSAWYSPPQLGVLPENASAFPSASTAIHKVPPVRVHETSVRCRPGSMLASVQALAPPVGSVDVHALPSLESVMAHSTVEPLWAHETAVSSSVSR
jgi:hypothetical protein